LGLRAHSAFEASAAVAFWFFLSLVPLLVLAGYLLGLVARAHGVNVLLAPLLDVVPGTAEGLVRKELERLAGGGAPSVAPLGVAGFLWTASSGLHNLMDVFEVASAARPRPWWTQRAIAIAWVLVGLAVVCGLAWLLVNSEPTLNERQEALRAAVRAHVPPGHRAHRPLHTPGERVVAAGSLLVVRTSLLAGFYRFAVEHPAGVRRRVWPGTAVAVVSWLAVSWAFGAYAVSIADYAFYYGSLAAVAVLLVWLYLTSLALVLGAEVNAQLEGVR